MTLSSSLRVATTTTSDSSLSSSTTCCGSIQRQDILVVAKLSRFDRDKATLPQQSEQSIQDLLDRYQCMGEHGSKILTSHWAQQEALAIVHQTLSKDHHPHDSSSSSSLVSCTSSSSLSSESCPPRTAAWSFSPQIIHSLDSLDDIHLHEKYKLIVSLGGDDFFKMVASRLNQNNKNKTLLLLGVNSDPATSRGALLPVRVQDFPRVMEQLEQGHYSTEQWTRIQVQVTDHTTASASGTRTTTTRGGPALNDVFVGQGDSRQMSKHQIVYRGEKEYHQGSGLLVSTGTGSTGWFASAGLYLKNYNKEEDASASTSFSKSAPFLKFVVREPLLCSSHNNTLPKWTSGTIYSQERLRIVSLNDDDGIISCDSIDRIPFPRGSIADISIHPSPLSVVLPESSSTVQAH